ncbi:MAG: alpha-L-arabinofuranosidase C-terminal domain-containing protein, partial [Woeseiaceae bacterium]
WYDPASGRTPGFLWQQNTLRDALVAAVTLDVFHRHADRVRMSAIAQMVNVLQAMILTEGEQMILTPTYHVFEMYITFQGATWLPAAIETPEYRHGDSSLPAVDVSAARATDGRIHVAFVNLDPDRPASVSTTISGISVRGASGRLLTAPEMDAHNSFESPHEVEPEPFEASRERDALVVDLPPMAVVVVAIDE